MMHSISNNRSNMSIPHKHYLSTSRVADSKHSSASDSAKDVRVEKKSRSRSKPSRSGSVSDLRRIKRRLFLDAVRCTHRQHRSAGVPGKKDRTGQERLQSVNE